MWLEYFRMNRYNLLFLVMLLCFFILPTLFEAVDLSNTRASQWLSLFASSVFMALASYAVGNTRIITMICSTFVLLSMVMETTMILTASAFTVALVHHVVRILFFSYIILQIFKCIFRPSVVTLDTISASLCGYLMIGVLWANLYSIVELTSPDCIAIMQHRAAPHASGFNELTLSFRMLYFSFVTLSTVGYGDVVPLSPVSRMLAVCEAIIGQLYLLVMVSRLVGIHVAQPVAAISTKTK